MDDAFDYVIVGGGSAGCVLASRLSENPDVTVLLLESGGRDDHPDLAVPPAWPSLWGSNVDYSYNTVPQEAAGGGAHNWPRGHTLGGSSSINAMVHLRGHRNDFDTWAQVAGESWSYDAVLPYFMKSETVPDGDAKVRGDKGPLRPAPSSSPNPVSQTFLDAAAEAGHPATGDFNGTEQEGAGWHDLAISDGARLSVASAYLAPVEAHRPNDRVDGIAGAIAGGEGRPLRCRQIPARRRADDSVGSTRRHSERGCRGFTPVTAAVGNRTGRGTAGAWNPRRTRSTGCRTKLARPSPVQCGLRSNATDSARVHQSRRGVHALA